MTDEHTNNNHRQRMNRLRIALWTAAAFLLLLPLISMQFTDEVVWTLTDFVIFGVLLVGAGVAFELVLRKTGDTAYRWGVGVALAAAFILIWVNGAVGIIGSEDNDANLMFFGVLAVGLIGAFVACFKPRGMARAMIVTTFVQILAGVIALVFGFGSHGSLWPLDILILTGFFVALWLLSAWLFQKAAWEPTSEGSEFNS